MIKNKGVSSLQVAHSLIADSIRFDLQLEEGAIIDEERKKWLSSTTRLFNGRFKKTFFQVEGRTALYEERKG